MPSLKILITGGAGYLGSILCEHLLDKKHKVTVVDNLMYGEQNLFHLCANPDFDFVQGDARDESLMRKLVSTTDVIIPLAAIVGAPACDRDPLMARTVNLDAVQLILKLRTPSQLVVYPTTNSGYGTKSGDVYCTEETPLEPISLYGQTKTEAEAAVLAAPNTITLRLATVFGLSPRMRMDLLVNHFVFAAASDRYLVIFEKDFKRNYIHIRDVADCFIHCIENAPTMIGRPYNVGLDAANLSKEELALKIKEYVPGFFIHFAEVGSDPDKRNYIVSNQRLRETGFEAKRSLYDGIRELLKGYALLGRGPRKNI
ncbi:NAD(P)-dependent oxidoreductase [Geobacter sp.]|uniref:NAD-dependent epimerase/dehydratase family protein n=1 Tax=Geobacter sp. TaxID=46610 RepID=UPI00260A1C42|nr:NAD(P)-dependent oxidoreductase [Geobacter sp.]